MEIPDITRSSSPQGDPLAVGSTPYFSWEGFKSAARNWVVRGDLIANINLPQDKYDELSRLCK
ncbi:hypothetical protein HY638_02085 [Candidatus Woesearchaeota archaeon]|nr:hypothetical protein [Candidatus Woesearchaeota archaeon]